MIVLLRLSVGLDSDGVLADVVGTRKVDEGTVVRVQGRGLAKQRPINFKANGFSEQYRCCSSSAGSCFLFSSLHVFAAVICSADTTKRHPNGSSTLEAMLMYASDRDEECVACRTSQCAVVSVEQCRAGNRVPRPPHQLVQCQSERTIAHGSQFINRHLVINQHRYVIRLPYRFPGICRVVAVAGPGL